MQDAYVGSHACAECHQEIFNRQASSNHALTLRPTPEGWAEDKVPPGFKLTDPGTGLVYQLLDPAGKVRQAVLQDGKEIASAGLDLLLGSGHHGVSPMSFDGSTWRYLSLTYYAKHGWDFSPMHGLGDAAARQKNATGWPVAPDELEKCFGCHSTRLAFDGSRLDMQRSELGVRCESCHGPGRAHVEAVRSRTQDIAIPNPSKWATESHMALCEQCHNETATLEGTLFGIPDDPASPQAVKFHVHGLRKSRCFTEAGGKLRCSTCHDPHGNSETDASFYEARCLSCHASNDPKTEACPVSPKKGCLPCHMPKVQVEKYTHFADHWIRARSPFTAKAIGSPSTAR